MRDSAAGNKLLPAVARVIAAFDIALWDLKARINEEPLWKTLGGTTPKANAHLGLARPVATGTEMPGRLADSIRNFGYRAAKIPLGSNTEANENRLEKILDLLRANTREPAVMVEFSTVSTAKESILEILRLERQFDLTWVEGAAPTSDYLGLRQVSDAVSAAVCAGRGLNDARAYMPLLQQHSMDVVQIDLAECGITAALQIADAAYAFELPVTFAPYPGNVQVHFAGVLPYFMSMEVTDPSCANHTVTSDIQVESGWAVGGMQPGHGLMIEEAKGSAGAGT